MTVRPATAADVRAIGGIAEEAGLFPSAFVPDMIASFLKGDDGAKWLIACDTQSKPVGFAFAKHEDLTDRVWNLLALGVSPAARGQGHATTLLSEIEESLGARMIVIDTTQRDEQAAARSFYETSGYLHCGTIKDFYAKGEDKLTYAKVLPQPL